MCQSLARVRCAPLSRGTHRGDSRDAQGLDAAPRARPARRALHDCRRESLLRGTRALRLAKRRERGGGDAQRLDAASREPRADAAAKGAARVASQLRGAARRPPAPRRLQPHRCRRGALHARELGAALATSPRAALQRERSENVRRGASAGRALDADDAGDGAARRGASRERGDLDVAQRHSAAHAVRLEAQPLRLLLACALRLRRRARRVALAPLRLARRARAVDLALRRAGAALNFSAPRLRCAGDLLRGARSVALPLRAHDNQSLVRCARPRVAPRARHQPRVLELRVAPARARRERLDVARRGEPNDGEPRCVVAPAHGDRLRSLAHSHSHRGGRRRSPRSWPRSYSRPQRGCGCGHGRSSRG